MSLTQTSAPAAVVVSKADLKTHVNVESTFTTDDTLIESYVADATRYVERLTNRQLITATWVLRMDGFGDPDYRNAGTIMVPKPPLQSITSIQYVDGAGDTRTWSASEYRVDLYGHPARITPEWGYAYPSTRPVMNSVTITYVAGYGAAASDVPTDLALAVKFLAAFWYEQRMPFMDAELRPVPMTVNALAAPFRVERLR